MSLTQLTITVSDTVATAQPPAGSGANQTKPILAPHNTEYLTPPEHKRKMKLPQDPLDTFTSPLLKPTQIPTSPHPFTTAVHKTITLATEISTALNAYMTTLSLSQHPDLSKSFVESETIRVKSVQFKLRMKVRSLRSVTDLLYDADHTDFDKAMVRTVYEDGLVIDEGLVRQVQDVREYVDKARAYLVGAHVFYKVNYALCPVEKKEK